jgi:hypothetical protein
MTEALNDIPSRAELHLRLIRFESQSGRFAVDGCYDPAVEDETYPSQEGQGGFVSYEQFEGGRMNVTFVDATPDTPNL